MGATQPDFSSKLWGGSARSIAGGVPGLHSGRSVGALSQAPPTRESYVFDESGDLIFDDDDDSEDDDTKRAGGGLSAMLMSQNNNPMGLGECGRHVRLFASLRTAHCYSAIPLTT
jgi:hypothetical protein